MPGPDPLQALEDATPLLQDAVALRASAEHRGHAFFRRLIEPALVQSLRRTVLQACARRGWLDSQAPLDSARPAAGVRLGAYDAPWLDLQYELSTVADFMQLDAHAPLRAAAALILGGPVVSAATVACRLMSPHAAELTTPPHQDRHYFPDAEEMWTVWIPLGDIPRHGGGLAVLEGSHHGPLLPHAHQGDGVYGAQLPPGQPWRSTHYGAGDVLLFHSLTVHRAFHNTSEALRLSIDLRYVPAGSSAASAGRS